MVTPMKIWCVLLLLNFSTVSLAKDWSKIRVGIEGAYQPFNYIDSSGKIQGFEVDLAKAMCRTIQAKCLFVLQDWKQMISALLSKKYDVIISSMSITKKRKKRVLFSDKYYSTESQFIARIDEFSEISTQSLSGKIIGVQSATTHENYVSKVYQGLVKIKRYGTLGEAKIDLLSNKIDLVLADLISLNYIFLKASSEKKLELVGEKLDDPKYFGEGIGMAFRKRDQALHRKMNDALHEILQNGVYDEVRMKYFDFDILHTSKKHLN